MTDLRKAAEMALDALEKGTTGLAIRAIPALRQALAQPEQKLIGWKDGEPQYVAQPEQEPKLSDASVDTNIPLWGLEPKGSGMVMLHQRKWVGLTDDDMHTIRGDAFDKNVDDMNWAVAIARKIDFILRKRNT